MTLDTLSPHHELFIKAYRHNWDRGTRALKRILKDKSCDRATAQFVYWLGHPEFYNEYDEGEIPSHAAEVYALLKFIEERFGEYPSKISFDPATDFHISVPKDLGRIPAEFVVPTKGTVQATDLAEGRYGKMLLVHAAREGDIEALRQAIAAGLDVDEKIGREYLLVGASISGQAGVVALLAEHGAKLERKTGPSGFTALHWASQSKREPVIEALLGRGVSIDVRGKWGRTALHNAVYWEPNTWAECGMDDHVAFLLAKGADPLAKDSRRQTPLDRAKEVGNKAALTQLKASMKS